MNQLTPEQIADNAAAVAAHLRGETVECLRIMGDGKWLETDGPTWSFSSYLYRPIQWQLGPSVNGHTLPAGRSWLRPELFRKDDLPEGWRPLMEGEPVEKGDELCLAREPSYWGLSNNEKPASNAPYRTRRPIAAPSPLWSGPEHVPVGAILDYGDGNPYLITSVGASTFSFGARNERDFDFLNDKCRWRWPQSSTWKSCTVESTNGAV